RSTFSRSPATRRSTARRAQAPSMRGPAPTAACARGGKAGPGGARPAPRSPPRRRTPRGGGPPTGWAAPAWPAGGSWARGGGPDDLRRHEVELLQRVVDWTRDAEGWRVAGRWKPEAHVGALSLIVPESLTPHDLGAILDTSFDIAVRPGLHCAPYIHRSLGTYPDGTLRLSPGPFNTTADIDAFLQALSEITTAVA